MLVCILSALVAVQQEPGAYLDLHRRADERLSRADADGAREDFARCLELSPENATLAYGRACAEALDGKVEVALYWLHRAVDWGYPDAEVALWDEHLAPLRGKPFFDEAIERMRRRGLGRTQVRLVPIALREAPASYPTDIAIDAAGRFIAVGRSDGVVAIREASSGQRLHRSERLGTAVWAVSFHPTQRLVVALTRDGRLHFWRFELREPVRSRRAMAETDVDCPESFPFGAFLEFNRSGEGLLVAARRRGGSLWSADAEELRSWTTPFGHFFAVQLDWSSDGRTIAAADGRRVYLIDAESGERTGFVLETPARVECVRFDPARPRLATGHDDGHIRVWDIESKRLLYSDEVVDDFLVAAEDIHESLGMTPEDFNDPLFVNVIRFSPDGSKLAFCAGDLNPRVVLDAASGRRLYSGSENGGRMGEPVEISWSPDGARFWCAFSGGAMAVKEVVLGRPTHERVITRGRPPRVSPAGIGVLVHAYFGVAAIDTQTGQLLWHRPNAPEALGLVQAATGHFRAASNELDELVYFRHTSDDHERALVPSIPRLFDPKRVRAAMAGVPLVPVVQ